MPGLLERLKLRRRKQPAPPTTPPPTYTAPSDVGRATKIAEAVRDLKLDATRDNLILAGTLNQRTKAIVDMAAGNNYDGADAALVTLTNELKEEKRLLGLEKTKYDNDKKALEDGDLKQVPAKAPPGLVKAFGAITTAKAALPADPKTLADYKDANAKLVTLKGKVAAYLALAAFVKTLKDGGMSDDEAAKGVDYAEKIQAGEKCDEAAAIKMAKTALTLSKEGFTEDRALLGAKVNQALLDDGMDEEKAGVVTRITKSGGSATVEDTKTVARGMKVLPTKILKVMKANGSTIVACQGPMTDYRTELKGVVPRGWPPGSTWDSVPGVHMGGTKEVVIGTMDDGAGKRKVPGPGEGPAKHGAYNLIAHEGGHAFDNDGAPAKNTTPAYRTARTKDITDGKMVDPKDSYFLQAGNAGLEETFAECCARHFGNDPKMATDWPALKAFWTSNPWS